MPLLPIDLQTLFGQAPQVGREQGIQRNGVPHAQALQGAQLVQRAGEQDASVNGVLQFANVAWPRIVFKYFLRFAVDEPETFVKGFGILV